MFFITKTYNVFLRKYFSFQANQSTTATTLTTLVNSTAAPPTAMSTTTIKLAPTNTISIKTTSSLTSSTTTTTGAQIFCCPEGWVQYRGSCFHQTISKVSNPNTLTSDQIVLLCEEQPTARVAILSISDTGNNILTGANGFNSEIWFDAYRPTSSQSSFYSNNNLANITYDAYNTFATLVFIP